MIEYVPGVSLDEKLERDGFTEAEVVSIGVQIAEGLKAAHEKGIVHRDLKPSNLRMTPEGRLKILDFGLAKLIVTPEEQGDEGTTLSRFETQTFGGTPHYMSPEQRSGPPVDARSDLYSTGMVLKELLGGKAASSGLQQVIDRCLQRKPEARYPSAAALLSDLEAVFSPSRTSRSLVGAAAAAASSRRWVSCGSREPR